MKPLKKLPQSLSRLINDTLAILDEVIREQAGEEFYRQMQSLRQQMASDKRLSADRWHKILVNTCQTLAQYNNTNKRMLAHSFTLMIALVNACETAYRTWRLQKKKPFSKIPQSDSIIVFVLTAHPTEARSPAHILLFQQIRNYCLQWLKHSQTPNTQTRLKHLLKLAWLTPVARHRRPSVLDEADSIFSTILRDDILNELIYLRQQGCDIRIRTWVGGDKDGHPDIDETVLLKVMACARKRFITIIKTRLGKVDTDLSATELPFRTLRQLLNQCHHYLQTLSTLKELDYQKIEYFKETFNRIIRNYQEHVGILHPELGKIKTLLELFPALLIPLELREDAQVVHSALKADKPFAITRMLDAVARLCRQTKVEYYVKGLVLSMTQTEKDFMAGLQLAKNAFSDKNIRIVPLFETESALDKAVSIMESIFQNKTLLKRIQTQWDNKFEIMLGYSDSAKGMGVLASRLAIANTMRDLDTLCNAYEVTPIFFHGSGGSIDRGGGSVEEQTAWWPQSSFLINKTTLQGEMVERSFASRSIMKSMIAKLLSEAEKPHSRVLAKNAIVQSFAKKVSGHYQQALQDPLFLEVVSKATCYRFLDKLRFGSRPVKRVQTLSVDSLRAIPWVLCWMQTRVLFPTWWGIGSAWSAADNNTRMALREAYQQNPLFRSFLKLLGFTLAKVDLSIWKIYLTSSEISPENTQIIINRFTQEYNSARDAVLSITEQTSLLWFRPWLEKSIQLRSPLIHPLNLLQILALKENDAYLFRETTSGIAAGMLTTG